MKNRKKKREISMIQVTKRIMHSKLWLNHPPKTMAKKIQMTQKRSAKTSLSSQSTFSVFDKKISSRRKGQGAQAVQSPNQVENTPSSNARNQGTSFLTVRSGKLRFKQVEDMTLLLRQKEK
jgi:hypothetical protein